MDWKTIDWLYLGGHVWATARGAVVVPATFELLDDDGDRLVTPQKGIAFYSNENDGVRGPHGWCYVRRDVIRAVGFAEPRTGELATAPPPVGPLTEAAAFGSTFGPPWLNEGAEIVSESDASSPLGKGFVLKFSHDGEGEGIADGLYLPLDEIAVINTGITDPLAEP